MSIIKAMEGIHRLMAMLLFESGLWLKECLRLRAKELDFEMNQIIVRDGKGAKDRITVLPESTKPHASLQEKWGLFVASWRPLLGVDGKRPNAGNS
ncbi:MAG: tyrosine-type recombinase/integrase [Deltaproteobacteria bacterium]|nr:tyrosine-type recombinase/integrase [Deltaproteobacteria bacterium]